MLFLLASIALSLAPGPDNIFVLTQSALHGRKAGIFVTLGLCTGLIFHTTIVALGLHVILQTTGALLILKVLGALYLSYLAYKTLRTEPAHLNQAPELSSMALYRRGIMMNISNPKVALFFLAFLPQFIPAESHAFAIQVATLGIAFAVTAFFIFSGIALAGGALQRRLKTSPTLQVALNRIAALVFILLAINLVI